MFLPRYTEEQFLDMAVKVCPKLKETTARLIGNQVWKQDGDIMEVISIGKLAHKNDGPEEIEAIMETMMKYGEQNDM